MDLLISLVIFLVSMVFCVTIDYSICFALILGLVCLLVTGLHRGFSAGELLRMVLKGGKTSFIVFKILFFIGCLTAVWRASGTISFFVYYGVKIITPQLFIVIAFMLTAVLSFILGTSFGVTGTAGVMLMILARSGGVNELITAGAIISGAYFGDMCSPASSAAILSSTVSGVKPYDNVKMMLKTSFFPLLVSVCIFTYFSVRNPIAHIDEQVLIMLESNFNLSWLLILPAIILLILPWFKVRITPTIIVSIFIATIIAVILQGEKVLDVLKYSLIGYTLEAETLDRILAGGGVITMLEGMFVVLISSTYSGIFKGTGMLENVQQKLGRITDRLGLFPTQIISSILWAGVFCNQAIGIVLNAQVFGEVYKKKGASKAELATDIGNSAITIAGLVPWSVACTVPLSMLGVTKDALLYCVLLYMVPFCYLLTKTFIFKVDKVHERCKST